MRKVFYLILVLLLFIYCGQKQQQVKRYFEDGVEVVVNHTEPYKIKGEPKILFLEEEVRIDTERDEFAEIGFTDIYGFDVDSKGNIYCCVSHPPDYILYKFDNNGRFVKGFVKVGQGPGEVTNLTGTDININDEIEIHQRREGRIYFYDKDGNFIREKVYDSLALFNRMIPMENGNYLVFWQEGNYSSGFIKYIGLYNSEFEERKTLDSIEAPGFSSEKIRAIPFSLRWAVSKKNIFLGNDNRGYEIWIFDLEGNLVRKIRKEHKPVKVSKEYKTNFMAQFENVDNPRLQAYVKKIYFPKHRPPFHTFFTDEEERFFVRTFEKGENPGEYIHDIFNQEGVYIGRKSLNVYWIESELWEEYAEIKNNRLYCLRERESGYKELVVYKMRWE